MLVIGFEGEQAMILNEVYAVLKQNGFTSSHNHFSKTWLNKSPRYMSMIRASGREPSIDALARLACNLKQRKDLYEDRRMGEITFITNWLVPLTQKVWTEFYKQSLNQ